MQSLRFLTIDPSLGRLDYESMSDQALMEMVVSNMQGLLLKELQDENGNFKDACEWLETVCDDDGNVRNIYWSSIDFELLGTLESDYLPPMLKTLELYGEGDDPLCGTLETRLLPSGLYYLFIKYTKFSGTLDFRELPNEIRWIELVSNCFEGEIVLESLPGSLTHLNLIGNVLTGTLNFDHLPHKLTHLDLAKNHFVGTVSFEKIPESLGWLDFSENALTGHLRVETIPETLLWSGSYGNNFANVRVEGNWPKFVFYIDGVQNNKEIHSYISNFKQRQGKGF